MELPPDPETGRRRQRFETFRGSKKEADKRLTELLALVDTQRLGVSQKATLGEYLERWLTDYAGTKSAKTRSTATASWSRSYIVPHLGSVRLDQLAPMHFVGLQSQARETERTTAARASCRRRRCCTSTACCTWPCAAPSSGGCWPANPMAGVKAPRPERREMRCFDAAAGQRFLAGVCRQESAKWQAFFRMLLVTGARPGELQGGDVGRPGSGHRGAAHIQRHVQRIAARGFVVGDTKTRGSRRSLRSAPT